MSFLFGIFLVNSITTSKVEAASYVTWCPGEPGNCNHTNVPGSNPVYKLCGGGGCIDGPSGYSLYKRGCEGPQQNCDNADVKLNPGQLSTEPCGWTNTYIVSNSGGVFDYVSVYQGDCAGGTSPGTACSATILPRFKVNLKNGTQTDWITLNALNNNYLSIYKINDFQDIRHAVFIGSVASNNKFNGKVRLETPVLDRVTGTTVKVTYFDADAGKPHIIPAEYFKAGDYKLRTISKNSADSGSPICDERAFSIQASAISCGGTGCSTDSDCAPGNSCRLTQFGGNFVGQCRLTQCANSPGSCTDICTPNTNVACGAGCYNNGVVNSQGTCTSGNSCIQQTDGQYKCKLNQCVGAPGTCNTDGCSVYAQCNQACNPAAGLQSTCAPGYVCNPTTSMCNLTQCYNGSSSCDATQCTVATCTPSDPAAATLNFPINDSEVTLGTNNSVNFGFLVNSYGNGCPANNNLYSLQLNQVEVGQPCGATYVSYGQVSSVNNLLSNKKYCWRVYKTNGTRAILSSVGTFRTASDSVTVSKSNSVQFDVCGTGYSGKFGTPEVTNPIEFNFSATKSNSNSIFKEIWIALVQTNVSNQDVMSLDSIRSKVNSERSIGFRYVIPSNIGEQIQSFTVTSAVGGWDGSLRSADGTSITNTYGTASVIEIGTNTLFTVTNNSLTGKVKIRLNDSFPSNLYNIYTSVIFTGSDGLLYSSDSSVANQFSFTRVPSKAGSLNWGVDLINPGATVTSPTYNQDGTFNVSWSSTDNLSGVKNNVYSYITATENNSLINVSGVGDVIPIVGAIPTPPTPSNGGITGTSLTTKTYRDLKPELGSEFTFAMNIEDNACNKTSANSQSVGTQPWLLSYKGSVSANGGIVGTLPSSVSFLIPETNDSSSSFISSYSLLSGNATLPNRNLSKFNQYTRDYSNIGALPPADSGFTSWYDYTFNMVQKNLPVANNQGTLSGNVIFSEGLMSQTPILVNGRKSSALSSVTPSAGNNYVLIAGNVTFNTGFVCDKNITFFVTGSVTINPDFNIKGANCVIISRGNVNILNGINKTRNVPLSSSTQASYDIVNGFFITDGNVVTQTDNVNGATRKWDGIVFTGGIVANDFVLRRSINLSANSLQPATIVIYDPSYRESFGLDFSFNKYSVREDGI